MTRKPLFLTILLVLGPITAPAALWVERLEGDRAILRAEDLAGLDRPTDGLSSNQMVYVTEGGEVKARLRLVRVSPPRVEARILTGSVTPGARVAVGLGLTWEHLWNPWDLTRIDAWLTSKDQDLGLVSLGRLWQTVAPYLPVQGGMGWTPATRSRDLLTRLSQILEKKDPKTRAAWQRLAMLLYRRSVLNQNIAGSLDLYLEDGVVEETRDAALRLRASVREERGDGAGALGDLGQIIRRRAQPAAVAQAALETARILAKMGETEKSIRLLSGLTAMESDDPGLAGGTWDEAALLQANLLAQPRQKAGIDSAMALLKRVRKHGGDLGILAKAWFMEFQIAQDQGLADETARVNRDFQEALPDSPLRAEVDLSMAMAQVSRNTNPDLRRLDPLQAVVLKWPQERAGYRAYQALLTGCASIGEWSEMLRLVKALSSRWPLEKEATSPLPSLSPFVVDALARERQEVSAYPFQTDPFFYQILAVTRGAYVAGDRKDLVPMGRFHQALSAVLTLTRPVVLEHARFDPVLVALAVDLESRLAQRFGKDPVPLRHDLRRLARLPTFPPPAASTIAWDIFDSEKGRDILVAEKQAYEILRLGADSRHVDGVFAWFTARMRIEADPLANALTYRHLLDAYDRLDLRVEDLRRQMGTWPGNPEVMARLALGEVPGRPAHALVFSHTNAFDRFDIFRDMKDIGSNRHFRFFKVTGPEAAIESRFLTLRARDYSVLQLTLLVEDADLLDRGTLWWQDWSDSTWTNAKSVPFYFLGPGEVTATIPLKHAEWTGTIKRLKIDFHTKVYPSKDTRILLREIVMY